MELLKYPRTQHIQGSRLQAGDEDLAAVPFAQIAGRQIVIEEKMDGANAALSFSTEGELLLQSRGHYLSGGTREKHFNLFKQWCASKERELQNILGARYICYGEWLYAKHTIFYDLLPHYFLEFDVFDRKEGVFLSTPERGKLLEGSCLHPVKVLFSGKLKNQRELISFLGSSYFISSARESNLKQQCSKLKLDEEQVLKETDPSCQMEGLYIKVEEKSSVLERYKFIRASFLSCVLESESHWLNRPIVPNLLKEGAQIYAN